MNLSQAKELKSKGKLKGYFFGYENNEYHYTQINFKQRDGDEIFILCDCGEDLFSTNKEGFPCLSCDTKANIHIDLLKN